MNILFVKNWRGGRVVEGARLESVYTGNRIEGSNPSLSARGMKKAFFLLKTKSTKFIIKTSNYLTISILI